MTDHKYTDEEIIKALEYCKKLDYNFEECKQCPYGGKCYEGDVNFLQDIHDLINRQSEDIDRLIEINSHNVVSQYEIKAEAIKEFAERLKKEAGYFGRAVAVKDIDNLVEELTAPKRCPDCKYFAWCECFNGPCDLFEREE